MLGVTLPQFTEDVDGFIDAARRAEGLGLDSIWVFDHLWPLSGGKQRPMLEGWTALAWLAEATERVTIGTLVTRSSLRHPAVLAKMVANVGAIAPGRVIVAVGSGDRASRPENDAFGLPYFAGSDRVRQLVSAVEVLLHYLHEPEVSFHDAFVDIEALSASPRPNPPPSVWLGGRSPELLEVAGRLADGWNGWASTPQEFALEAESVRRAAGDRSVELSWGGLVMLGADDADATDKLGTRPASEYVVGGPATVAAYLSDIAQAGARHLVVTLPDASKPGTYELLAHEVRPRVGGSDGA